MPGYAIVGMQWGDEGKGKIVDYLTKDADLVVRHQGGNNAGHTIVVGGVQTILHIIPSGVLHPDAVCVVGNGTVIDPQVLCKELDALDAAGCNYADRLKISSSAHIILPYHKALDGLYEQFRGKDLIGTTGRGIGPAYADKANRIGIRFGDLMDSDRFAAKLDRTLQYHNLVLVEAFGNEPIRFASIFDEYCGYAERLRPFMTDTTALVQEALRNDKRVVFEGAQGAMLDLDHGTFPYVTSSTTLSCGACSGAGVGPADLHAVIGIVKAYTTRVGEGPFPTELHDEQGDGLRKAGHEFGATTGRPRRCGWLDCVQLRRAARINGTTALVLTKPDVLSGQETLRICTGYMIDNKVTQEFPPQLEVLEQVTPVYEELSGWKEDISACRDWDELPENARRYFERIAELLDVPIAIVSVGPGREQTIVHASPFEPTSGCLA